MPVLGEGQEKWRVPRWALRIAAVAFTVLLVLTIRLLWVASSRPVIVRTRRHWLWLGPQLAMGFQNVEVSPGWYRMIFPEAPNGAWTVGADTNARWVGPAGSPAAMPPTFLTYFQIGPVRYALLLW